MQMGLAEEHQDNIVPGARLLLFSDLGIGIAVCDEVDLDVRLLAFSNSFAQRFRFSSDAGTKWLRVNMVSVRVAAYSGGVWSPRSPQGPLWHQRQCAAQRPPTERRHMRGVNRHGCFLLYPELSRVEALLLNLMVRASNCSAVIVYAWMQAVNKNIMKPMSTGNYRE